MSFWEVLWLMFISFALLSYLMVLFSIITDLYRDQDASGWAKALWTVALIFVPFITALVYLMARGRGMTERSIRSAETMRRSQEAYVRELVGKTTPSDQIAQARAMLDAGVISQPEYDRLKEKALV